jgi:hypothetical protein
MRRCIKRSSDAQSRICACFYYWYGSSNLASLTNDAYRQVLRNCLGTLRAAVDMKAAVVPSAGARWQVKEVSTPKPSTNQVLTKIHATRVCHTDAFITEGKHPMATISFTRGSSLTEVSRYSRGAENKE